ncbi:MAG: hypothetical protein JWQ66_1439 [Mucilaginibacter sp.]|nr:hypothetical protein [Mucilaginibacter sp.]
MSKQEDNNAQQSFFKIIKGIYFAELNRSLEGKTTPEAKHEATLKAFGTLKKMGLDPSTLDAALLNETNRKLKESYAMVFTSLAFLFTSASYLIVIYDAKHCWGINPTAIQALIIETPIQFIGILYIIARNLFPK